ncbi:MAG: hypothetical protein JKY08_06235 [Flavobacteriaceae bacterium]|nr:hypothetical protein [Flavobacteriaceae bacterium]
MQQENYLIENPPIRILDAIRIKYLVSVQTKITGLSKEQHNTITYELEIDYTGDGFFDRWEKSNFSINGGKVFGKMDELYLKASKPIENLVFKYKKGKIDELYNYTEILKKWELAKSCILDEFQGEIVDALIVNTDENMYDKELLTTIVSNNLILQGIMKSTLNDPLIYYGTSIDKTMYSGLMGAISLLFSQKKSLGLKGNKLELKTSAVLQIEQKEHVAMAFYLKKINPDFSMEKLHATIESTALLDYKTIWIDTSKTMYTLWVEDSKYKKEITIILKKQ